MKRKKKTKSLAKLKKELDKFFSLYVRQFYADKNGMVKCYTCPTVKHWKEMQNGHFVSRQHLPTRWHLDNCRVQCVGCNVFGNGQLLDFEERLVKELSRKKVEALKASRHQMWKLDTTWYLAEISRLKEALESLSTD